MIFGSVCSGIEAASVAWEPLGWRAAFLSEIEPFPRAVLAHHWPKVPLHGDFTTIRAGEYEPIDVLVGGTPCQSFSIAGLRGGMADARGNLALEYLKLADRLRPRWLVWENVPGVLSSNGGRDFGAFLGGMVELGYGFAYRVLDAQHFHVAQRRRRVFVVGHLGDWRRAAAVLFERESLSGHPAPRREAGKDVAPTISARPTAGGGLATDFDLDGGLIAKCLSASHTASGRLDPSAETFIATQAGSLGANHGNVKVEHAWTGQLIAHTLKGEGHDASEDGTGRGVPLVPVAFTAKDYGADAGDLSPTLRAGGHTGSHANGGVMPAVAFNTRQDPIHGHVAQPLGAKDNGNGVTVQSGVRRLTPEECETLQSFPRGHTLIPWRGKLAPDGPRYKALGNSMNVNVMRWLGERIALVDAL